jgi:hypothetical protein
MLGSLMMLVSARSVRRWSPYHLGQVVRDFLIRLQVIGKLPQNAASQRDVAGFNFNTCRLREGANDGQEGCGGQQRRFIRQGVNDFGACFRHGHRGVFLQDEKGSYHLKPSLPTFA